MREVWAPWTPQQISYLNQHQQSGYMHPFTCKCPNGRNTLIATVDGWVCPTGTCGWSQRWAFEGMADGSIDRMHRELWNTIQDGK